MTTLTLYKKDKRGGIQTWKIQLSVWSHKCIINVYYGKFNGKMQKEQTDITSGKAGRTVQQQAELQYNSLVSSQKDKGYKSVEDLNHVHIVHEEGDALHGSKLHNKTYGTMEDFLNAELPDENTDANGNPKPMKCTALQDTKTNGVLEKVMKKIVFPCIVQPKLDGVRCTIKWNSETSKWQALSSSGKSYDVSCRFILNTIKYSELPKDYILDGEIYIHGESLEYISGKTRKQTPIPEHEQLEFHLFDIIDSTKNFESRNTETIELYSKYFKVEGNIVEVDSYDADNKEELKNHFDIFTSQGYEGLIIRNTKQMYKQGARSSDGFKWKAFQDAEYEIIGVELGKRGSEDMVFVLKTADGLEFKAKPLGNRRRKEEYVSKAISLRGKKATVQFLTLSEGGIPQGNPRIKAIRDYE